MFKHEIREIQYDIIRYHWDNFITYVANELILSKNDNVLLENAQFRKYNIMNKRKHMSENQYRRWFSAFLTLYISIKQADYQDLYLEETLALIYYHSDKLMDKFK